MKIIAGLGNPGSKYEFSRHNAGFLLVDFLALSENLVISDSKFQGVFGKGELMGCPCIILKPMTYMNRSGLCVSKFLQYFKVESKDLIVIHDDVDLPKGEVRLRRKGGAGGHNGIKSILAETGKDDFSRIKIGVGRPGTKESPSFDVSNWVLGSFDSKELDDIRTNVFEEVSQRLQDFL